MFFFLLFSLLLSVDACPPNSASSFDGVRCFTFVSSEAQSFDEANDRCARLFGGQLAIVRNGFDNTVITSLCPPPAE